MDAQGWNLAIQHLCADEWRWSFDDTWKDEAHDKQKIV